tara:strand:+ start:210 stop:1217 length:1008 start_codon:yes stop_codon:yes gene_type:complete
MNYHYDLGKDIVSILLQRFSGKKVGTKECNKESMMEYLLHEDKVEVEINKKKVIIEKESICSFKKCKGKSKNDSNNSIREKIIYSIINGHIPDYWYKDERWCELKDNIYAYAESLDLKDLTCSIKAGRMYNYDFDLNDKKVEFKFNAKDVTKIPQFLSLSSKFNTDYGGYFYDNYVEKLSDMYGLESPTKDVYLKNVYGSNYKKVDWFNEMYKNEKKMIEEKKELVNRSIHEYLEMIQSTLNLEQLSKKFLETQKDKHYMLYHNNTFHYDCIHEDECKIISVKSLKYDNQKKYYNTIILETNNPKTTIHMLLRWRNHSGILNPAWQIRILRRLFI